LASFFSGVPAVGGGGVHPASKAQMAIDNIRFIRYPAVPDGD
jgi:hypothetical protein